MLHVGENGSGAEEVEKAEKVGGIIFVDDDKRRYPLLLICIPD